MSKKLVSIAIFFSVALFTQTSQANHQATVKDAWIADAPPVAKIRAGYLHLHNNGAHTISIKGFSSLISKK